MNRRKLELLYNPVPAPSHYRNAAELYDLQWNCYSYGNKRAVVQQHISTVPKKPEIFQFKQTVMVTPTHLGFCAHVSPAEGRGVCTSICKRLTFIEHNLKHGCSRVGYTFTAVTPSKQRQRRLFNANTYSSAKNQKETFKLLLPSAIDQAKHNTLQIGRDVNAAH
ncbi:hypothetical protein HPB48_013511 [Haemaphysalis longicornis]|uniref:Uncharacterized protein n=1 Tax=Haemaphysalis longicornis TaxID=44386 RepID=A0A9J6GWV5_HAELO|nr:hypothetical protein HPB48_013511 [Haemaphysalis longicornis]